MTEKLEKKLSRYEENKPISNRIGLEEAVRSIIDEELSKPDDEIDFDLIDEASEFLLFIEGENTDTLEDDAQRIAEDAIEKRRAKCSDAPAADAKTSKKHGIRKKWIIPLAAAVIVLAGLIVTCYSLGLDVETMTKKIYSLLKPNTEYSDGVHDVIKTDDHKEYKTLKEMTDAEQITGLLTNDLFNDPDAVADLRLMDYGNYYEILIDTVGEYSASLMIITPDNNGTLPNTTERVGILDVYLVSYDDIYQAEWYHNGNYYNLSTHDRDTLISILEGFRES